MIRDKGKNISRRERGNGGERGDGNRRKEGRKEREERREKEGGAHRDVSTNCSPYSSQRVPVSIPVSSRG